MKSPVITAGNRLIGSGNPVFIVAELSANHGGSLETAKQAILDIKETGADAVKVQTFKPEGTTIQCDNEYFRINAGTQWDHQTLFDLYGKAVMPWEWQPELKKLAESLGLIFFSTATSPESADFMEAMNSPIYKIASFEISDTPLINYVARKRKPIIFSKGIATLDDLRLAVDTCRAAGNHDIAILQCTSEYPASLADANLATIPNLAQTFSVVSGLSDHTLGIVSPVAAVALGASIIEKHFISDKSIGSVDASFSLDKGEFKAMVQAVRDAEKAIGSVSYTLSEKVARSRTFMRSLFVVEDIVPGEPFSLHNVRSIRPGHGLHPQYLPQILGKKARHAITRGTPLSWDLLA